jgi:membrane protease YdiL (CAAX protease family)
VALHTPPNHVRPPALGENSSTLDVALTAPTPWTARNLLVLVGCGILAFVAANFLTVAGYMLLAPVGGWRGGPEALRHNTFFLLSLQGVFHGLLLGVIYLFLVVNHGLPFWGSLKWRRASGRTVWRFFLAGIALAILIQFAPPLLPDRDDFPLQRLFSSPEAGYAIAVFAIVVAPFMEELIFRGVFFAFFEHLAGVRLAVLGSAALFAALHVPEYWGAWNHVMLITLVGLAFSLARGMTGSVTPSYVLHVAYNASLITGLYFQTQGFRNFPGTIF